MCIAAPGKVVKTDGKQAEVDYGGGIRRKVLVTDQQIRVGDCVLVQMGIVIKVLAEEEKSAVAKAWANRTILPS